MTSPFPGMDPYLEGSLWSDFHRTLILTMRRLIVPQLPSQYFAVIESYVMEDKNPGEEIGIMYPDLGVLEKRNDRVEEPSVVYGKGTPITPPTISLPSLPSFHISIPTIEIRDIDDQGLISVIEVLSPVNKRNPGLKSYQNKRLKLHKAGINLLEVDLLRRGQRVVENPNIPFSHYMAVLQRGYDKTYDVWTMDIKDKLPVLPLPLKRRDKDIVIDLQLSLNMTFKENYNRNSINYRKTPPPPAFSKEDKKWIAEQLKAGLKIEK